MRKMVVVLCLMWQMMIQAGDLVIPENFNDIVEGFEAAFESLERLEGNPKVYQMIQKILKKSPKELVTKKKATFLNLVGQLDGNEISFEEFEDVSYDIFTTIPVVISQSDELRVGYRIPQPNGLSYFELLSPSS